MKYFLVDYEFTTMEVISVDRLSLNHQTFELTKDHIREGVRKDGGQCPLALALWNFFVDDMNTDDIDTDDICINVDFKMVTVEYSAMDEDSDNYTHDFVLDDAISNFIRDFDIELIDYREFEERTMRIELLEDQSYKLSFVPRQF